MVDGVVERLVLRDVLQIGLVHCIRDVLGDVLGLVLRLVLGVVLCLVVGFRDVLLLVDCGVHRDLRRERMAAKKSDWHAYKLLTVF